VQALVPSLFIYPLTVKPADDLQLEFFLENKNTQSPAYDVIGNISCTEFTIPFNYSIIPSGNKASLRLVQKIPKRAQQGTFNITAIGTYTVQTGELFSFTTRRELSINSTENVSDMLPFDIPVLPENLSGIVNETINTTPNSSSANVSLNATLPNVTFNVSPNLTLPINVTNSTQKSRVDAMIDTLAKFLTKLFGG
jgi:hypothetical protein